MVLNLCQRVLRDAHEAEDAAGKAAAGLVSASVAALTEGVLRTMLLTKLKTAAVALLTLTVLGTGAGLLARRAFAERPASGGRESAAGGTERAREPAARDVAKGTEFAGKVLLGKKIKCRRCGHEYLAISDADTHRTNSAPPVARPGTPPESETTGEPTTPDNDDYLL